MISTLKGTPPTQAILAQAPPILLGQLAGMAYYVIDTMMIGHFSRIHLAAVGLGISVYATVFISLLGPISALSPIIAQHHGALRARAVGESYTQGLWFAAVLSACGVAVLAFPQTWLRFVDAPPDVKQLTGQYLRIMSVTLPAMLVFRVTYLLNIAVSRPATMVALLVAGLLLKGFCNFVLIFGAFGLPAMGAAGCGLASLVVAWAIAGTSWLHTYRHPTYRALAIHVDWPRKEHFKEMLRLGIPMGLAVALESTSFTLMAVFIARLGPSVMGGHQIVMSLGAFAFQVPLALGIATATLVSHAIGAGDLPRARETAFLGIRIGFLTGAIAALALWVFRRGIVALYTNDAAVAVVALSLIGYLCAFHVFDSLQGILAFVLRAYKITVAPMVVYGVILWGLGLGGGYVVAFTSVAGPPRGAAGMWLMQAVALCLAALVLLAYYVGMLEDRRRVATPTQREGERCW